MSNREGRHETIWLKEEQVFGETVGPLGAHFTTVRYVYQGIEYEVLMEREEFTLVEDISEHYD